MDTVTWMVGELLLVEREDLMKDCATSGKMVGLCDIGDGRSGHET